MKRILKLLLIGVMVIFPNVVHAETLDVNSKEVKDLVGKYQLDSNYMFTYSIFLPKTKNSIENLTDGQFVTMTTELGNISYKEETRQTLPNGQEGQSLWRIATKEEYNKAFAFVFGPNVSVKQITEMGQDTSCGSYVYNSKNDNYEAYQACGGTSPLSTYIKSASKDTNSIAINIKAYDKVDDLAVSNGKNYITPVGEKANTNMPVNSYDSKEVDQKYGEYLNTYKFTFKKASDNNYYFYSVENLNDAKEYKLSNEKGNTKVTITKKEQNPKTADQNIVMISIVGIGCLGILFTCTKKLFKN